jgi:hypothetical protein
MSYSTQSSDSQLANSLSLSIELKLMTQLNLIFFEFKYKQITLLLQFIKQTQFHFSIRKREFKVIEKYVTYVKPVA